MIPVRDVKYVVFSGGAARAVALCTALDTYMCIDEDENRRGGGEQDISVMDNDDTRETRLFDRILGSGGTSIGAVLALAVLFGPEKWCRVRDRIVQYDTWKAKRMLDCVDLANCNQTLSLCSDAPLRTMIDGVFEDLELPPTVTFANLSAYCYYTDADQERREPKTFVCNASCHEDHSTLYMSAATTPDLTIHQALRMSMALPGIFPAIVYQNRLYVDGGLFNNFIVDQFPPQETVGFSLASRFGKSKRGTTGGYSSHRRRDDEVVAQESGNNDGDDQILSSEPTVTSTESDAAARWRYSFVSFIMSLIFSTIMIPDIANLKRLRKTHAQSIVPIYTPGIGPLAFPITPRMIRKMKEYGRYSVLYHKFRTHFSVLLASISVQLALRRAK